MKILRDLIHKLFGACLFVVGVGRLVTVVPAKDAPR
jgi:hypothetical protein